MSHPASLIFFRLFQLVVRADGGDEDLVLSVPVTIGTGECGDNRDVVDVVTEQPKTMIDEARKKWQSKLYSATNWTPEDTETAIDDDDDTEDSDTSEVFEEASEGGLQ